MQENSLVMFVVKVELDGQLGSWLGVAKRGTVCQLSGKSQENPLE